MHVTDALPYVHARAPGVVDHPPALAARAKPARELHARKTFGYLFSRTAWSCEDLKIAVHSL